MHGAAPRSRPTRTPGGECAGDEMGARKGTAGRPTEGRRGGRAATPPSGPQAAGAPAPILPRQRGCPPFPRRDRGAQEGGQSKAHPPAPAACSHRNRREQANPRQRARTPHGPRPETASEHEPERYGGHALHDQNDASDGRFVACPGKAEGRNEAERPPAPLAPPGRTNGGHGAWAAPLPHPTPRHGNAPDTQTHPTRGAQPQAR